MMGRPQAELPGTLGNGAAMRPAKRFAPENRGFRQRTEVVNSIIERWPIVCGTGSLLEAHLVGRLALAGELPSLVGCAISEAEVWQLCQTLEQPGLVILSESVAVDRGLALIHRLQGERLGHRVLLLVQDARVAHVQAMIQLLHQGSPLAMVHVESFGSGVGIRALLSLKACRSFCDPLLRKSKDLGTDCQLTTRETQTLRGLSRGLSNKLIAAELGVVPTTVRDYVSALLVKLGACNRTDAVGKALEMGLIER